MYFHFNFVFLASTLGLPVPGRVFPTLLMFVVTFIVDKLIIKVLVLKMHINLFALHFLFEPSVSKSADTEKT